MLYKLIFTSTLKIGLEYVVIYLDVYLCYCYMVCGVGPRTHEISYMCVCTHCSYIRDLVAIWFQFNPNLFLKISATFSLCIATIKTKMHQQKKLFFLNYIDFFFLKGVAISLFFFTFINKIFF